MRVRDFSFFRARVRKASELKSDVNGRKRIADGHFEPAMPPNSSDLSKVVKRERRVSFVACAKF